MADNEKLLEIHDLQVEYHSGGRVVHAVNGLDLSISEGETLGFVGETGAGKTSTALSILRILPQPLSKVTGGTIRYRGKDLMAYDNRAMRQIRGKEIAMIFQDPMTSLDPVKKVSEQIAEMIRLHEKLSPREIHEKALHMLEVVGIDRGRGNDYPHQFSGGMKQRVVIAMALACNPSLLIADEPTTALDVTIQAQVLELMKELKKQYHMSMIMITHDLGIVAEICDNVAIMYAGKVVEYGSVREIYTRAAHPYTTALFDSIPSLTDDQEELKVIRGLTPDPTSIPSGCAFHPRCPFATERCARDTPGDTMLGGTHTVKCFRCQPGEAEGKEPAHE
ncbi:MAG: ABC transporter ATP-binding protein [Oscillospiraceae bacterium]|nr:ABC transporter ATP-binding protein [Oscillospiraceae bacterium]